MQISGCFWTDKMDPIEIPNKIKKEEQKTDESQQPHNNPEESQQEDSSALTISTTAELSTFSDVAVAGFLDNFKLELTNVSQEIRNLTDEQNKLLDKVGEHNTTLQKNPDMTQLIAVMDEMKGGMDRLSMLRQDMSIVHERSIKLRGRAEKLENFCKNAHKKEDDLVAKMVKPSPTPTSRDVNDVD